MVSTIAAMANPRPRFVSVGMAVGIVVGWSVGLAMVSRSLAFAGGSTMPLAVSPVPDPSLGPNPVLTPMGLAAEYVSIDISYVRWLWWPAVLYLFWGMAFVCDVYFVRTIDVISERFQIPDDVAGATLMALGCNGPEMALNTISIFHPSNIGVGAVVGGEVFNVLVIIGVALLATPDEYLPLKLGCFNFFRDVVFYMVSVGLLYWTLADGSISRLNSAVLLTGAFVYIMTVIYSSKLSKLFSRDAKQIMRQATARLSLLPRNLSSRLLDDDGEDEDEEADPETLEKWCDAYTCADLSQGSVLGVRVDVRNRLMDRGHRVEDRFIWMGEDALWVSTVQDPRPSMQPISRAESGLVYSHDKRTHEHHWHHGGLVNQPVFLKSCSQSGSALEAGTLDQAGALDQEASKDVQGKVQSALENEKPPVANVPGFCDAPWEIIPLEDVLYCESSADHAHFNLHVHRHDSHLGSLITLELNSKDSHVLGAWTCGLRAKMLEQRRRSVDAPPAPSALRLVMEWFEWLQFPVKFFVARTIPDMDNPKMQHLYPVAFTMSMFWLAVFAYLVVRACDGIHEDFGISITVLGFTVAAAGTSFPNVFSGMCVAKQGKTSMAVANALGANVQNVFLALAVPWTIQSFLIEGGPFPMPVDNLIPAVAECFITLMPVVLVFLCCSFSMPRWAGGLYLVVYVVYLVFALGQQLTDCPKWPFPC